MESAVDTFIKITNHQIQKISDEKRKKEFIENSLKIFYSTATATAYIPFNDEEKQKFFKYAVKITNNQGAKMYHSAQYNRKQTTLTIDEIIQTVADRFSNELYTLLKSGDLPYFSPSVIESTIDDIKISLAAQLDMQTDQADCLNRR